MFKNRKFEVKMVKDEDRPIPARPLVPVQEVVDGAATLMVAYFALSTLRGIITHVVVTRVQ